MEQSTNILDKRTRSNMSNPSSPKEELEEPLNQIVDIESDSNKTSSVTHSSNNSRNSTTLIDKKSNATSQLDSQSKQIDIDTHLKSNTSSVSSVNSQKHSRTNSEQTEVDYDKNSKTHTHSLNSNHSNNQSQKSDMDDKKSSVQTPLAVKQSKTQSHHTDLNFEKKLSLHTPTIHSSSIDNSAESNTTVLKSEHTMHMETNSDTSLVQDIADEDIKKSGSSESAESTTKSSSDKNYSEANDTENLENDDKQKSGNATIDNDNKIYKPTSSASDEDEEDENSKQKSLSTHESHNNLQSSINKVVKEHSRCSTNTYTESNNSPFFDSHIRESDVNHNHQEVTFNVRHLITNESIIQGTGDSEIDVETNQNQADADEETTALVGLQDFMTINNACINSNPTPTGDKSPLISHNSHSVKFPKKTHDNVIRETPVSRSTSSRISSSSNRTQRGSTSHPIDKVERTNSRASTLRSSGRASVNSQLSIARGDNITPLAVSPTETKHSPSMPAGSLASDVPHQSTIKLPQKQLRQTPDSQITNSSIKPRNKLSYGKESYLSSGHQSKLSNDRDDSRKSPKVVSPKSNCSSNGLQQHLQLACNEPKCLLKTAEVNQRNPENMLYALTNSPIEDNNDISDSLNYQSDTVLNGCPNNMDLTDQVQGDKTSMVQFHSPEQEFNNILER